MLIACPSSEPKENYGKLLAIPSEDMTGKYARYWLASAGSGNDLWFVSESDIVNKSSVNLEFGVRPRTCKNKLSNLLTTNE